MRINYLSKLMMIGSTVVFSTYSFAHPHTAQPMQTRLEQPQTDEFFDHRAHAKEHGGQTYQLTTVESKWVQDKDGHGAVQSEWETWFGGDINKVFFRASMDKAESKDANYSSELLYSRNIADFWDVQAGVRYRYQAEKTKDQEQVDAVLGFYGMAQYFFETEAYLYAGQDERVSLSLHSERDVLLTQKLIVQPHIGVDVVLSDQSKYAEKKGLSSISAGVETRYEISKKVMPFVDISYQYQQGAKETPWQSATDSKKETYYAAGVRVKF